MQERRQTKQRAALLEALAHAEEPMSAEQLFFKATTPISPAGPFDCLPQCGTYGGRRRCAKGIDGRWRVFIWVTGPARSLFNLPQLPKKGEADTLPIGIGGKTAE